MTLWASAQWLYGPKKVAPDTTKPSLHYFAESLPPATLRFTSAARRLTLWTLVADVAELADALDSKSGIRKDVWVRPPPSAPLEHQGVAVKKSRIYRHIIAVTIFAVAVFDLSCRFLDFTKRGEIRNQ